MGEYLIHHGIKGMKWGVRHGPPYPLDSSDHTKVNNSHNHREENVSNSHKRLLTDKQKKLLIIGASVAAAGLAAYGGYKLYQMYGIRSAYLGKRHYGLSDPLIDTIKDYSDKSISLKAGTTVQRVSRYRNPDYVLSGQTYVSYLFNDKIHYKTGLNKELIWNNKSTYIHNIKLKEPLKAPSVREAATIYQELYPKASDQNFWLTMTNGFINRSANGDPAYIAVKKSAKKFKAELLKRGYNALIDIEDAGKQRAPLIILDTSIFGSDSVHKLGKLETIFAKIMR